MCTWLPIFCKNIIQIVRIENLLTSGMVNCHFFENNFIFNQIKFLEANSIAVIRLLNYSYEKFAPVGYPCGYHGGNILAGY
jgi:hypothetical protein